MASEENTDKPTIVTGEIVPATPKQAVIIPAGKVPNQDVEVIPSDSEVIPPAKSISDVMCEPLGSVFFAEPGRGKVAVLSENTETSIVQRLSIFNLLSGVYCLVFKLVDALKKYATDIAEVVIGAMLGGAVVRFGKTMFRRVAGLISL